MCVNSLELVVCGSGDGQIKREDGHHCRPNDQGRLTDWTLRPGIEIRPN